MRIRKFRYFVGDFETTVFEGQDDTLVWASAVVELFSDDVKIFGSIDDTFEHLLNLNDNICIYYHNLKFDGSFWLSYLMYDLKFTQAGVEQTEGVGDIKFQHDSEMKNNTFKYSISDKGQWYTITIKANHHIIEIRDSLKLLPFSVKRIGESFGTKHKKLDMEYKGFRYPNCPRTEEEDKYIANDVLVIKEALEIMQNEGHKKLTIGSCCLEEFKTNYTKHDYENLFPNIYDIGIDEKTYKYPTAGDYILRSYRGGWCYLAKGKANKLFHNGTTADVNSLYPSMMSSESGNLYPVGKPHFWQGDIPFEALSPTTYYFVRLRTRFYLKKGKLPFISIKNSFLYNSHESLETSDIYNKRTGEYDDYYIDKDGNEQPAIVELTLTQTDYELFMEHYDVEDFEILDGCWFNGAIGVFDEYIDKYRKIKMESEGAKRELAKLFLNNLYGKMASSKNSSYKVAYLDKENIVQFYTIDEDKKTPGYIPIGSAITSYARNFTIRAAQANYHGKNKPGFIYADTDSIHCDLPPEKIKGITVHPKNFCCWKLESCWDYAVFARQKTYIEHITHEDQQPIDTPYMNVKCAGMPDRCKKLFVTSVEGTYYKDNKTEDEQEYIDGLNEEELDFIKERRTLEDFKVGLRVPSKLMPVRIRGGVLLIDDYYTMRRGI